MVKTTSWAETYSGIKFYPLEPDIEDIDIVDIAHSLSLQCRFNGHCKFYYSVAEHSCHIFDAILEKTKNKKLARAGLLHDASESYLTDLIRPLKAHMPEYKAYEVQLESVIAEKYDLDFMDGNWPDLVKEYDNRILVNEKKVLMSNVNEWATDNLEPLPIIIKLWSPEHAKSQFLERFRISYR